MNCNNLIKDLIKIIDEKKLAIFDLDIFFHIDSFEDERLYKKEREKINKQYSKYFNDSLIDLNSKALEENFYYFDCPSEVYKTHFDERKKEFYKNAPDANEEDFIISELDYFSKPYNNRFFTLDESFKEVFSHFYDEGFELGDSFYYHSIIDISHRYISSLKRKIEFLETKLNNFSLEYNTEDLLKNNNKEHPYKIKLIKNNSATNKKSITEASDNSNIKNNTTPITFNNNIFKSPDAEKWFLFALKELNAIDKDNKAIRGFQAKANTIFSNEKCKSNIFKYILLLKDYISYLRSEFNATIKSNNKLSEGKKHEKKFNEFTEANPLDFSALKQSK